MTGLRARVFGEAWPAAPPSVAALEKAGGQRERDAGHLSSVSAVVLATARTWEGKAPKNLISRGCTVAPLASHRPFHPVPSPLPFLSPAEWSYLALYPPLQKLFHPCLHSF